MPRFRFRLLPVLVPSFITAALAPPAFITLAPSALGQEILYEVNAASGTDPVEYGAVVGDWNADGIDDLALMWRYDDFVAKDSGAVRIHSGTDGSVLLTLYGTTQREYFGIPVAMPDIDGDGIGELLVKSPWSDYGGKDLGSAFLFASGSGAQLWRFDGTKGFLGIEAGPVNDLDGDGITDVFVTELGAFHVLSGATGTPAFTIAGVSRNEFGVSAANLGDVNGDGVDDFLICSSEAPAGGFMRGRATIYSGADQSVLHVIDGTTDLEQLGFDCALIGDVDGDGRPEYVVLSAHEDALGGKDGVILRVHSSATNLVLAEIRSPDSKRYYLFPRIEITGDVNGDGIGDFALLASATDPAGNGIWAPLLYSARSLLPLYSFEHLEPNGILIGSAGDFDGDGLADILAGAIYTNSHVRIYGGDDLWLDAAPREPQSGATLVLDAREGTPNQLAALVIVGIDGAPAFQVVGGIGQFDSTGGLVVTGTVPTGLSGHDLDFKCFADDANGRLIESEFETISFR